MKNDIDDVLKFLFESNKIEGVYDARALMQSYYAWKYLQAQKKITSQVILKTHKILMLHQPLYPDEKGYYRRVPVYIGGHEAIKHDQIRPSLDAWMKKMNYDSILSKSALDDVVTKELHVEYEGIHPFVDGNGRTGRMFMNWWRKKNGLPLLIIHEGDEQMEYYKWFQ